MSICLYSKAQNFNGYIYSDFSGINGISYQPANVANSPYKFDFSIINANFYATNSIGALRSGAEGSGINRFINNKDRFLKANGSIGGLSVLLSLPRNQGIALRYGIKAIGSNDDISSDFISALGRFADRRFVNTSSSNQKIQFNLAAYHELAFTYGAVLKDNDYSRVKFGLTLKGINPLGGAYFDATNVSYGIDGNGIANFTSFDINSGYSNNLDQYETFDGNEALSLPKGIGFKPAVDIGLVFEKVAYWPDPKGESGTAIERDITYELRFGFSITDLGWMTFDRGSASFESNGILALNTPTDFDNFFTGLESLRQFRDSLSNVLAISDQTGEFTMSLPAAFNANFDYNFNNNWYLNIAGRYDLTGLLPVDYRIRYPNGITITPRYETGITGFYFPVFANFDGDMELGLGVRYGPFVIGTQSIGSLLSSEKTSLGAFFSINLRQLKANSTKPYCFGSSKSGSAFVRKERTPIYKRKKFIFF